MQCILWSFKSLNQYAVRIASQDYIYPYMEIHYLCTPW
jgi:hypothetical protein